MALLLSACVLRPPDPLPRVEACVDVAVSPPAATDQHVSFIHSTALPDCRDGGFEFDGYRHIEPTFATGVYDFEETEPQDPTLRKHDPDTWFSALKSAIDDQSNGKRLIVFIHGYATRFDEAHMDAAEVRALAGDEVPVVVLHWPSRGSVSGYIVDRASLAWAQDEITAMVARMLPLADDITLVSHSLGAKAVLDALRSLDVSSSDRTRRIKRVVLASPDIDRHLALRMGGALDQALKNDRKVLVYASRKDKALKVSRDLNGYARLGSTNCKFDIVFDRRALGEDGNCHLSAPREGLAVVDTGPSDAKGLLRHNDFLKSCQVREDLRAFLRDKNPPTYRVPITRDGLVGFRIDSRMEFDGAPCNPIL